MDHCTVTELIELLRLAKGNGGVNRDLFAVLFNDCLEALGYHEGLAELLKERAGERKRLLDIIHSRAG